MPEPELSEPFREGPSPEKGPWMVALMDILGFSRRLEDRGLDQAYADYRSLVDRVLVKEPMRCVGTTQVPGKAGHFPMLFSADIRYCYFSDTLLLWMPLTKFYPGPFLQRCADLVCEALLIGVPMRGAVSLGNGFMHKKSGTYLGEAIVEAARLEAAQNWIGVCLAPSATWEGFMSEVSPTQLMEYAIPIKEGREELASPIALDWPRRWRETQTTSLAECLNLMKPNDSTRIYYENALAFSEWSTKYHDWHEHPELQNDLTHLRMQSQSTSGDA
jgi:hypothetical protein